MNLIIGAAAGYEVDQIRNFVLSLRKVYKGKVVLVYNKSISKKICIFLFKNNINILISDINSRNAFKKRYQIYLDILKNFGDIKKLLITDVRDVYFQEDPFKNKLFSKLNFFMPNSELFFQFNNKSYNFFIFSLENSLINVQSAFSNKLSKFSLVSCNVSLFKGFG